MISKKWVTLLFVYERCFRFSIKCFNVFSLF